MGGSVENLCKSRWLGKLAICSPRPSPLASTHRLICHVQLALVALQFSPPPCVCKAPSCDRGILSYRAPGS
eukprot:12422249-Karenia_brevis.AAC.1